MRAVVQRVSRASVRSEGEETARIGTGLLVLVGVASGDDASDAERLAEKVATLRIFPDDAGAMNRSVIDAGGAAIAVSQFTLLGDARRGRRPSFIEAAEPSEAAGLFEAFCAALERAGVRTGRGRFQTHMEVELVNDGPVTILLDSQKRF